MWVHSLIIIAAIAAIGKGAHWVIDSATHIADRLGISHLIIGLTVVAFGTSAPEFAVTLIAAFKGSGNISVGNVVGSNIFNLGFILGGCALFRAIPIRRTLLFRDGTILAGTTLLIFVLIGLDLHLDRIDGALLFVLLGCYLGFLFKCRKASPESLEETSDGETDDTNRATPIDGLLLFLGLLFIIGGSHFLVDSATVLARGFGVTEWVIGVTIVAAGTSIPEFATSLTGAIKGRYDLSVGSIIGSDIFNLLGVLGVAGMVRTLEVDAMARVSLGALSAMVFLVLIFMRSGWRISRLEGALLVAAALLRWGLDFFVRTAGP